MPEKEADVGRTCQVEEATCTKAQEAGGGVGSLGNK